MGWLAPLSQRVTDHFWQLNARLANDTPRRGDSHTRSIAKAISYRAGGLTLTILVVWVLSGRLDLAAAAGFADTLLKIGLYYFHERIWNRSNFGLKSH